MHAIHQACSLCRDWISMENSFLFDCVHSKCSKKLNGYVEEKLHTHTHTYTHTHEIPQNPHFIGRGPPIIAPKMHMHFLLTFFLYYFWNWGSTCWTKNETRLADSWYVYMNCMLKHLNARCAFTITITTKPRAMFTTLSFHIVPVGVFICFFCY